MRITDRWANVLGELLLCTTFIAKKLKIEAPAAFTIGVSSMPEWCFFAPLVSIVAVRKEMEVQDLYEKHTHRQNRFHKDGNTTWHIFCSKHTFLGFTGKKQLWILKKLWSYELIVKLVYPEISQTWMPWPFTWMSYSHTSPAKLQRKVTVKLLWNDHDLPWNCHEFTHYYCEFSFSRWNILYILFSIRLPSLRVFGGSSYSLFLIIPETLVFASAFLGIQLLLLSQWLPTRTMTQVLGVTTHPGIPSVFFRIPQKIRKRFTVFVILDIMFFLLILFWFFPHPGCKLPSC